MREKSLLLLWVILSSCLVNAADREQAAVEKVLRDSGLSPRSRPSGEKEGFALEIRGTEQRPELATTSCSLRRKGNHSIQGKRFRYEADNRGEWGGQLNVYGSGPKRAIVGGNVVDLIAIEDDLYVFTGLDHLLSTGGVDVIESYDSNPASRHLTETPEAPSVVVLDRNWGGFLIVSSLSVSLVTLHGSLHMIMARHAYLPNPNSVLTIGRADILVGVCGGVAWIHAPWRMNRPPDPARADEIPLVTYWTNQ